jgi:hypothetical protein
MAAPAPFSGVLEDDQKNQIASPSEYSFRMSHSQSDAPSQAIRLLASKA